MSEGPGCGRKETIHRKDQRKKEPLSTDKKKKDIGRGLS